LNELPVAPQPLFGALLYVAAVNIVIWAGLFGYVFFLERKLRNAMKHLSQGGHS
jgi:CcmD family protein